MQQCKHSVIKYWFIICSVILIAFISSIAKADEEYSGLSYTIIDDEVEIIGLADDSISKLVIPDTIEGLTVTSMGDYAFSWCDSLTSITIPDSVTSIGNYAFEYCTSLTSITIPDSVTSIGNYAFENCTSLTSITIPDSVTRIGDYAFDYCTSLISITIPDSVTSIGSEAFSYTIEYVIILSADTNYEEDSFSDGSILIYAYNHKFNEGEVIAPTKYRDGYTLYTCSDCDLTYKSDYVESLDSDSEYSGIYYTIDDDQITITGLADDSITEVTIPDTIDGLPVTIIGYAAFRNCTSLTSITIPDTVTSIDESAFYSCTGLTGITIPASVTNIGDFAFYGCSSLEEVIFVSCLTKYDDYTFSETPICHMFDGEVVSLDITVDHFEVIDEAVEPTYTKTGLTEGSHCSVCGKTLVAQKEVKALYNIDSEIEFNEYITADNNFSISSQDYGNAPIADLSLYFSSDAWNEWCQGVILVETDDVITYYLLKGKQANWNCTIYEDEDDNQIVIPCAEDASLGKNQTSVEHYVVVDVAGAGKDQTVTVDLANANNWRITFYSLAWSNFDGTADDLDGTSMDLSSYSDPFVYAFKGMTLTTQYTVHANNSDTHYNWDANGYDDETIIKICIADLIAAKATSVSISFDFSNGSWGGGCVGYINNLDEWTMITWQDGENEIVVIDVDDLIHPTSSDDCSDLYIQIQNWWGSADPTIGVDIHINYSDDAVADCTHNYIITEEVNPTCTESGYITYVCEDCK
jgi:hypothetical protein